MRLPVVPQVSTKDGISNKNARLTNTLKETAAQGEFAVVRPGLSVSNTYAGLGSGLVVFDGRLLTIVDDTIYDDEWDDIWWPLDAAQWSPVYTYGINDFVWYDGVLWFSISGGNIGNTPGTTSVFWDTSRILDSYDEGATYGIGDQVVVGGTVYYSYSSSNVGYPPLSNPELWKTSSPPSTRYTVYGWIPNGTAPIAATKEAANEAWFSVAYATQFQSCRQPNIYTIWYDTRHELIGNAVFGNQYANPNGRACSDALGPFDTQIGTVITL